MDPFVIVSIATAISSLLVAVLTHLKYSKCMGFSIETTMDSNHTATPTSSTMIFPK